MNITINAKCVHIGSLDHEIQDQLGDIIRILGEKPSQSKDTIRVRAYPDSVSSDAKRKRPDLQLAGIVDQLDKILAVLTVLAATRGGTVAVKTEARS
jgi:hypothetical protein